MKLNFFSKIKKRSSTNHNNFFHKILAICIFSLFLGANISTPITAITTNITSIDELDQQQTQHSGAYWVYECRYMAQEFKPTLDRLTKISLLLSKSGTPPNELTVSIRNDLYGSDLISTQVTSNELSEHETWIDIDVQDITVTPEKSYYIVCKTIGGSYNPNHLYGWHCHENNPYNRGNMFRSTTCGQTWTESDTYDTDFCFKTYGYDSGNVDPPVICITAPEPGYISDIVNFQATATSDIGIDVVCFYVDGQQIGQDSQSPYGTQLISTDFADGTHTLKATAFDTLGQTASDSVEFIFDNNKPSIEITNPNENDILSGLIEIKANAKDQGSGIEKVEFYVDHTWLGTDYSDPYDNILWNTLDFSNGAHTIKVKAYDYAGFENSDLITVIVDNGNQPPDRPTIPSGTTSGEIKESYLYTSYTIDPDGDNVYYQFNWGDGTTTGWIGPYTSGQTVSASHIWYNQGYYRVKVKAKDMYNAESVWSDPLLVYISQPNEPPLTPSISGPSTGYVDNLYHYDISTIDPEHQNIYYYIDWGDGDHTGWVGPYSSATEITCSHRWTSQGSYYVRVKAKDSEHAESNWATQKVSISENNHEPNRPCTPSGPTSVKTDNSYSYSTSTTDLDGDQIRYGWDWNADNTVDEWTHYYQSGETITTDHRWDSAGSYQVQVKAEDSHGAQSSFSQSLQVIVITNENQKPNTPSVAFDPISKKLQLSATDPDEDQIRFGISWNNDYVIDQWTGFGPSGMQQQVYCNGRKGIVHVIAEDEHGAQSNWVSQQSKDEENIHPFLYFLENHQRLCSIIQQILQSFQ